MTEVVRSVQRPAGRAEGLRHRLRALRVIAAAEFKLKYSGSVLGYVWSVIKPLSLFTVLYLVFGRVFKLGELSEYYPLSLLIGIVLFAFFADATSLGMFSLINRETLLQKLVFPRSIIPTAATMTAGITFCVNLVVIAGFIAWKGLTPRLDWILIVPLLVELYVLTLGIALILSTLFVRFRDIGQIYELGIQLFFYATPILYPVSFLPPWGRTIVFLSPFTQILQDIRTLIIYPDADSIVTAADQLGSVGRFLPVLIAFGLFGLGLAMFKRDEPWFAERL